MVYKGLFRGTLVCLGVTLEAKTACKVCRIHVAFVVSVGGSGSTHRRLCTARAADLILPCTPPGQFHSCNQARTKLLASKDRRSRFAIPADRPRVAMAVSLSRLLSHSAGGYLTQQVAIPLSRWISQSSGGYLTQQVDISCSRWLSHSAAGDLT